MELHRQLVRVRWPIEVVGGRATVLGREVWVTAIEVDPDEKWATLQVEWEVEDV